MLSLVDNGFISIAAYTLLVGYLVTKYERNLPGFVTRGFKYGSFAYKGSGGGFLKAVEVPKAFFRHYYVFSSVLSVATLAYAISVYVHRPVDTFCLAILKLVTKTSEPTVSVAACLLTLILLVIQCCRRCYEAHYLQVFSNSARMNISHYVVGFYHYFGVIAAAVAEAPLFLGTQDRSNILWVDTRTLVLALPCVVGFAWAWYEQCQSNIILANLRKDKKSGRVVTEEYKVPHGRLFNYVSSPHRLCEIVIYVVILLLMPTKTYFCIFLWVISNQVLGAHYTHVWYKNSFKDYPTNRKAVFPGLL